MIIPTYHEVIFLRPWQAETRPLLMTLCLMVEMGVDFAYDDQYLLPTTLPDDPGQTKLVLINEASWDAYHKKLGDALKRYESKGVSIVPYDDIEDLPTRIRETNVRMELEARLAVEDVTLDNPTARRRLQSRSFDRLLADTREYLIGQMRGFEREGRTPWGDPHTCGTLETFLLLSKLQPDEDWHDRLAAHVDKVVSREKNPPRSLSHLSGLAAIVELAEESGQESWIAFAKKQLAHMLDNAPRREGIPVNSPGGGNQPRTEHCSFLLPSLASVANAAQEPRFLKEAFKVYDVVRRCCFEPRTALWYHSGRTGWRCPAAWGRGTGWALMGLTGFLRHLPPSHPRFEDVRRTLDQSMRTLARHQTDEGMWRNVIDHKDSRPDVSATAIITWSLAGALEKGWLKGRDLEAALGKGWTALRGRLFRTRTCTTTEGTPVGATMQFYLSRLHHYNGGNYTLHAGAAYELWKRANAS